MWDKFIYSAWFIYAKMALVVAVIAGASYLAWDVRGAYAEREQKEAVNKVTVQAQKDIDTEHELRGKYEKLTNARVDAILKSISKLQADFKAVTGSVEKERQKNPQFYEQPLPPAGYEQWKRARDLVKSSTLPDTQP